MSGNGSDTPSMQVVSQVVALAKQVLRDAESGNVDSLAVVVINKQGGMATASAGGRMGDMYVGAAMIQNQLLHAITSPENQRRGPRILRPMGMPG